MAMVIGVDRVRIANLLTEGEYRCACFWRSDEKKQSLGEKDTTKDTTAIGIQLVTGVWHYLTGYNTSPRIYY